MTRLGSLQPMKVVLNLVYLVPGETGGMETYARQLVPRLVAQDDLKLVCLVNREAAEAGGGPWGVDCPAEVVPVRATNRLDWIRGEQAYVPRIARKVGADVVHSLASTAPLWGSAVRVTTIHDLNFMMVPEAHSGAAGLGMRFLVPAAARRSERVISVSEATAKDLTLRLNIPRAKIDVVPHGVSVPPRLRASAGDSGLVASINPRNLPIVLCPGATRPHKNAVGLVRALATMDDGSRPMLVVTGYATPHEAEILAEARRLGIEDSVRVLGYLDSVELEGLYASASVVAVPSRYEGFGFPVLEAMSRGVPVAASDRSSLPEVAGGAALLFDPDRPNEIAGAVGRILRDRELAEDLKARGLRRCEAFSWAEAARLTVESYRRALSGAVGSGGQS